MAQDDSRPTSTSASLIIGAGMSGLLAAHRLQQAGVAVRDRREERRRRRHLVREQLSRAAGSTTRTTTTATRSRSATTGRSTSRPRTCCSTTSATAPTRSSCASTSASTPRSCRPTWSDDDRDVDRATSAAPTAPRRRSCANAVDQRGRPAQPAEAPRHRRAATRSPARRSTRRAGTTTSTSRGKRVAVIGTGASAVQFIPEIAPSVGELHRVPAHARRGSGRRPTTTTRSSDGLRWLYAHVPSYSEWNRFWIFWRMGDGALANVARRSRRGTGERRVGERGERLRAPGAHRVPRRPSSPTAPTCSTRSCRTTRRAPSGCSATTASGRARLKRDNVSLVTDDIREITPERRRHRRRRRSTSRRASSTAPASRRRSSSRR